MISLAESISRLPYYSPCLYVDGLIEVSRVDTKFLQKERFLLRGAREADGLKLDPGEGQGS